MKRKNKKLTRLIVAALMCTGGVHLVSPGVASANAGVDVTTDTTISDTTYAANDMVLAANNIALTIASGGKVNAIRTDDMSFTGNTIRVQGTVTSGTVCIYGGMKDMKVYIEEGATVNGNVYAGNNGGDATKAQDATNNILDIYGGTVGNSDDNLVGGLTYGSGNATKNTVNISGGAVGGKVMGGWAYENATGDASENTVNISGGTIGNAENATPIMIAGGVATSTKADKNTVNISGGTIIAKVYGGSGKTGASGNTINIEKNAIISGGEYPTEIYGGYSSTGAAAGNTVNISGGTVTASITGGNGKTGASGNTINITGSPNLENALLYGGMAQSGADNNTINIFVPVTVAHLLGGENTDGTATSGNTLNIASTGVSAGMLYGFQNINFYLPSTIQSGDTMLTLTGGEDTYNLTGVTYGVAAQSGVSLSKGNTVTLVTNPNGLTTDSALSTDTVANVAAKAPTGITTSTDYEFAIAKSGTNSIIATVTDVKENNESSESAQELAKSPVETRAATTTFVNAGADMLASQGFAQAANAVALDTAAQAQSGAAGAPPVSAFTPFAAFGGQSMRAQSGSYVDTKGFGLNIGFARELPNSQGKLLFGPVVEYGGGTYASHLEDAAGTRGDGKAHYFGVGIMARQVNHDGLYYEGSVRGGRVTSDYRSVINNQMVDYDSSSNYWAAHVGVGKAFSVGGSNTLDGYLKYFYSHQAGDDVTMHGSTTGDEAWSFDSVNSHRIRIGARLTHKVNERNSFYGGLAYQYEFGGEARAHYNGNATPSPSVKGSSGMLELGWQVKPGGPLTLDLGFIGWAGKQRGGSVQLGATWSF